MAAIDHARVFDLFDRLREADPSVRMQLLDAEPDLDPRTRSSVLTLLQHDSPTGEFLGTEVDKATAGLWSVAQQGFEPTRIGPYEVIRLLGSGGFGRVYLARETRPSRLVAVKILRPLHSPSEARRFEFEAEALARLNHRGIASVYRCGTDPALGNAPFIAMEYVDGPPVLRYAAQHELDDSARLRLLIELCRAVAHAHQSGVIHRDLSPRNVLVDGAGQVKLVDFGLAKPVDRSSTMTNTADGALLGTLRFMSPEQLSGKSASADVRSDVYALGLVCYELLAGRHPFLSDEDAIGQTVQCLLQASWPKASERPAILRGDGGLVLARALERNPERRYQSAAALADDLENLLERRPVSARPANLVYVARRYASRHRATTAFAAACLLAVVVFAAIGAWSVKRELATRSSAINALDAVVSRVLGPMAPRLGTLEDREALLASIGPDLDRVLAAGDNDDSLLRLSARYYGALADVQKERGASEAAYANQQRAAELLGRLHERVPDDIALGHETSIAIVKLGDLEKELGRLDVAYQRYREALEMDERLSMQAPDDIGVLSNLFWSYMRFEDYELVFGRNATAWRLRGAAIADDMMRIDPDSWKSLEAKAHAEYRLSNFAATPEEKFAHARNAIDAGVRFVAMDPTVTRHQAQLAEMAQYFARTCYRLGMVEDERVAREIGSRSVTALTAGGFDPVLDHSYVTPFRIEQAFLLSTEGKSSEALDVLSEREALFRDLMRSGRHDVSILTDLGSVLVRKEDYLRQAGRSEDADNALAELERHADACAALGLVDAELDEHLAMWRSVVERR